MHDGDADVMLIGCEWSSFALAALRAAAPAAAEDPAAASAALAGAAGPMVEAMAQLATEALTQLDVCGDSGVVFGGVDPTIVSSSSSASMCDIFGALGVDPFGECGTIAAAAACTRALRSLSARGLPVVGYRGLFLPVAEDSGLAARTQGGGAPGSFTCGRLLHACSVCAAGVDTVPVPGDADRGRIAGLFLDTAAVAWRLDKPLACRLLPMPGLAVGDVADFETPHYVSCRVMDLA